MNKPGFTLIGLLVAVGIFLTGAFALNYLLKTGADSVASAGGLTRATYALQAKMEELRQLPFSQLLAQNGQVFAQGQGQVFVYLVITDLAKVQLQLDWDPRKAPLKLSTLRSSY